MDRERNRINHGTVLVVLCRPGFVVLGSDTGKVEEMKSYAGQGNKIVCHPTLPLAISVAGMAEFTINDKSTVVTQLLESQMPAWTGEVSFHEVATWAKDTLLPLVKEANAAFQDESPGFIYLVVARCSEGRSESAVIKVQEQVQFETGSSNWSGVIPPETLSDWHSNLGQRNDDPLGTKIAEAEPLAAQVRRLIEEAIAADQARAGERLPLCAGHAEVVIVHKNGAKFDRLAPIVS